MHSNQGRDRPEIQRQDVKINELNWADSSYVT